ncbi:sodium/hydrogen exchanger family protein (macronuclear) [Tetrahymena thermophila SB210]|uniref:Sodium/hydrogen exchanger family protein n=1 Tax=Tetrahymena thermophila (strain SB210) TaxID=312017 RepID=I7M2Z1_TETTS|nr:sodium/hydrogen exchanger family protein [Tetrahymena thermophila SB210]EAS01743.2 sodium/hydrogen exchanger family protein [Tetrahymena thermophila SB210]|eukprot:XP_001021988.2 sodium/hydrogen exchanger family protein [Tetrahymena thermophila SB210]
MEDLSLAALITILILFIHTITSHVIEIKKITILHESAVSIGLGVIVAIILKAITGTVVEFNHGIFFNLILPPIIFAGGFNLRKTLFFENFSVIMYYGIIGTILCFIILAASSLMLMQSGWFFNGKNIDISDMLLFSAVLCATDTVAALSLVKESQYPQLNSVLFGEGIINDAISIVIFRSVKNFMIEANSNFNVGTIFLILLDFFKLLILSVIMGVTIGLLISYFFKKYQSFNNYPLRETSIIMLSGYFSYLIAEIVGLSGIISLFCCGLVMGHYAYLNISEESQKGTHLAFETVGYLAEAFVFAYLGISLVNINYADIEIGFTICMMFAVMFARCFSVYSLPCLQAVFKKQSKLNYKQLSMVWYSGTIRGAIAFGLTLMIESKNLNVLLNIILLIIIYSTIFLGSLMQLYGKWIGLEPERSEFLDAHLNIETSIKTKSISDYGEIGSYGYNTNSLNRKFDVSQNSPIRVKSNNYGSQQSQSENHKMRDKLKLLEQKYVKPIFQKGKEETIKSIDLQEYKNNIDKISNLDEY